MLPGTAEVLVQGEGVASGPHHPSNLCRAGLIGDNFERLFLSVGVNLHKLQRKASVTIALYHSDKSVVHSRLLEGHAKRIPILQTLRHGHFTSYH